MHLHVDSVRAEHSGVEWRRGRDVREREDAKGGTGEEGDVQRERDREQQVARVEFADVNAAGRGRAIQGGLCARSLYDNLN